MHYFKQNNNQSKESIKPRGKIGSVICICALFAALLALTGCGEPDVLDESELADILPEEITTFTVNNLNKEDTYDTYELKATSLEIERRQINEKNDIVYCKVVLEDDIYRFTKYLHLELNYYDVGGWILDSWEEYEAGDYALTSMPFDRMSAYFDIWYDYPEIEYLSSEKDWENCTQTFVFTVSDPHTYGTYTGECTIVYRFDGVSWTSSKETSDLVLIWDSYSMEGRWEADGYVVNINSFSQTSSDRVTVSGNFDVTYGSSKKQGTFSVVDAAVYINTRWATESCISGGELSPGAILIYADAMYFVENITTDENYHLLTKTS